MLYTAVSYDLATDRLSVDQIEAESITDADEKAREYRGLSKEDDLSIFLGAQIDCGHHEALKPEPEPEPEPPTFHEWFMMPGSRGDLVIFTVDGVTWKMVLPHSGESHLPSLVPNQFSDYDVFRSDYRSCILLRPKAV